MQPFTIEPDPELSLTVIPEKLITSYPCPDALTNTESNFP